MTRIVRVAAGLLALVILPYLCRGLPQESGSTPDSADDAEVVWPVIRAIYFDQREVFTREQDDWFFAAPLANTFHTLTKEYIIDDELLFFEGGDADPFLIAETERNLRRTGLFSTVNITVTPVGADSVDVHVFAQDRFSLRPALLFGTGGGITNIGAKLEEINLMGTATQVMAYGLYRTENNIGWEGMGQISNQRLFRSEIGLTAALRSHRYRTDQFLGIVKQFRTIQTKWGFGILGANAFGKDFAYRPDKTLLLPFHDRNLFAWIGQAYGFPDRLFISGSVKFSNVQRTVPESRQAFDNTGHILISFSSIRQVFTKTSFLDGYETEDLQEGAWGSVVIGRVFSLGNGGETMWYVGGTAEQSVSVNNNIHLFGQINGASGFGPASAGAGSQGARPRYTYLEINGLGHWRLSDHLVVAGRLRTQTAWNWTAYRQLVLDFESGLRGYAANSITGDNRVIGNAELRWFPAWRLWIVGVSGVAFYDVGSAWNQGIQISQTRYHHSVGFGFRIHNLKASGSDAIYRFDFAFNLDEKRFTGLIFSTNQLFSAFGRHSFKAPDVYGSRLDVQ